MTIRYPDLQVVLPRSVELSNYQQQRNHYPLAQQQQAVAGMEKKSKADRQQVRTLSKSEQKKKINQEEEKEKSNFSSNNKKDTKRKSDKKNSLADNKIKTKNLGYHIDFRT